MIRALPTVLGVLVALSASAQDGSVLTVRGKGVEGKPPYEGGGRVRFLEVTLGAEVLHYDGGPELTLPLALRYEVLEPAPIALTSNLGTEHWWLYHFSNETMSAVYTDERIDLSAPGERTAVALRGRFAERYGPMPAKGLVGLRGHSYFLIEPAAGGPYLDVTDPPSFFDAPTLARTLTFTLADLTQYSVQIADFQSTWQPGGPFRVRVTVTDAAGESFPVVNAPLSARAGGWETKLETEWGPLNEPTGWMRGALPEELPTEVTITGSPTVLTPRGPESPEVTGTCARGTGQVGPDEFAAASAGYVLPRNADGVIRETRGIWAAPADFETPEKAEAMVARCAQAGLNMIVADIFVRNNFWARSELIPQSRERWAEYDPLAGLIERAHAAGIEVHPWFCVTYRDPAFRAWFEERYGRNVDVVKADGSVEELPADAHRPEYRDFIVALMTGVARDYEVDGIHHDYIRVMNHCYCADCRAEFAAQFGKPITAATEEDWIVWHRRAIGDIVRRVAEGVRAVNPQAKLSAAVFSNLRGGALQGQDPAGWARAGWIDLVIPMDYEMQTLRVRAHERAFLEALDDDDQLVTGLSLYQRNGAGVSSRSPELVSQQIELVRAMGIHGWCLFAYSHLSDEQIEMLRTQVNPERAAPYFR